MINRKEILKSKRIYIYLVAAAASMSGCATPDAGFSTVASTTAGADQQQMIAEQKSQITNLEAMLQARDKELQQKDADLKASSAVKGTSAVDGLFPPDAKAGHCYARVLIPASWGETTETVLVREASERVEINPARYETVEERVMTKEASTRLETIPARYKTAEERVMVRPESKRIEEIPATYKTTTEQIMISPARTEWKRGPASSFGNSVVQSRTTDTGEVMCLVETPARYQTVSKKVVDRPAGIREVVIPAEYKTIKKTVLVEAAKTREISIPAEYSTIKVEKLKAAATERRIAIPAEHGKVTKRTLVSEDQLQWREVLCQVNMTGENIRALQTTLQKSGYDVGPIDGVLGSKTLTSANSYAKSNGLPYGSNYIDIETAKKLGLKI
jgi:hypothetical protein